MTDWHGLERVYHDGTRRAGSLAAFWPRRLDRHGVLAAWGERDDPAATVLAGVTRVIDPAWKAAIASAGAAERNPVIESVEGATEASPPGAAWELEAASPGAEPRAIGAAADRTWAAAFEAAVFAIAARVSAPVVALGGGLDGAAVLAAWRASGLAMPACVTLATGLAGYDEVDDAAAIARAFGARCERVVVTPAQIVDAIAEAVPRGEAPLYNLHPVGRWPLAREVARRGHDVLVTGDGGDAVFAGRPDHDYVPIVAAYTAASLPIASPYFATPVIAATRPDPDRRALRDYVVASGGADRPKRRRMMPALDLARLVDGARLDALARELDLAPAADVRWVTLDCLVRSFR